MDHSRIKKRVLPQAVNDTTAAPPPDFSSKTDLPQRPGIFGCPCCGFRTFPVPPEEAIAYICPVCMWENDVFTASEEEPSDENHGLTLRQGRENFGKYGVCDPRLARYARPPLPEEQP